MKKILLAFAALAALGSVAYSASPTLVPCNQATNAPCPAPSTGNNGISANAGFGIVNGNLNFLAPLWIGTPNVLFGTNGSGSLSALTIGTGLQLSGGILSATGGGGGGSTSWSTLTPGTTTLGTYLVGTGAALAPTAGGSVTANVYTGNPIAVANGGTGTASPALSAGANITLTGSWPSYTIAATGSLSNPFNNIATGTNNSATMTCAAGCIIGSTGGVINATQWAGVVAPTSAPFIYTTSASQPAPGSLGNGLAENSGVLSENYTPRTVTGTTDTIVASDGANVVEYTNSSGASVSLPQATGAFAALAFDVNNKSTGTITLTSSTSVFQTGPAQTSATLLVGPGRSATVYASAGNWSVTGSAVQPGPVVNSITTAGTSATPVCLADDEVNSGTLSATAGTFAVNAPSGCTPGDGQKLRIHVATTNVQTYSWNSAYVGGTVALPTASSGSSKEDWIIFLYSSIKTKWEYVGDAVNF